MTPKRGFSVAEFQDRVAKAQSLMDRAGLAALLLTTEPEIRYYTGFQTRFWESPTRPWYVVIPGSGAPIAVIPAIGAHLMGQTWVEDIRTWDAPDYDDDGISLLADALIDVIPHTGPIGIADQMESHLRMPLADFATLKQRLGARPVQGDAAITRQLRLIKSDAEIAKIAHVCAIAGRAFEQVGSIAVQDTPLTQVFRNFQALCLHAGADWVPYLAGAAGQMGYGDVISPATETPLAQGDVLMLDTGAVWDGYFCDFDRNFSIGNPTAAVRDAHARLLTATQAGFEAAKPGATMADLFHAMNRHLGVTQGRLGHGLGMQLTEWPSIIPADKTPLAAGMVLTLEPVITLSDGRIMVHEENIVIADGGARYLSPPCQDLAVI